MLKLLKVISSELEKSVKTLIVKVSNGRSKTLTAIEVSPFGTDSRPPKDMVAIYAPSQVDGEEVIIGYLNKKRLAEVGEHRIFSTNTSGSIVKTYIWLKNDGTQEFGGNTHNLVRYTPLNTGLQNEVTAINTELVKIAAAINSIVPALYTPTPITLNITTSKINELKTG